MIINREKVLEKVKSIDNTVKKILSIENGENYYKISYLSFSIYDYIKEANFSIKYIEIDLKQDIRDYRIDELLNHKPIDDYFDVEEIIYSDKQLEKLRELRGEKQIINSNHQNYIELLNLKKEYSDNFKINEPIYYKGEHGIITYKHKIENKRSNSLWSVKVGDTEFRYVNGIKLTKRKVKDLSHIPIDEKLNKLSTEKLLKMFRKSRYRGEGDIKIKRILNTRENIQTKETKIINLPH